MREYAVLFEKTSTGWSAYVPDLPDLGVAGSAYEATEQLIRERYRLPHRTVRRRRRPDPRTDHPRRPHADLRLAQVVLPERIYGPHPPPIGLSPTIIYP